jgi:hypothetical protein
MVVRHVPLPQVLLNARGLMHVPPPESRQPPKRHRGLQHTPLPAINFGGAAANNHHEQHTAVLPTSAVNLDEIRYHRIYQAGPSMIPSRRAQEMQWRTPFAVALRQRTELDEAAQGRGAGDRPVFLDEPAPLAPIAPLFFQRLPSLEPHSLLEPTAERQRGQPQERSRGVPAQQHQPMHEQQTAGRQWRRRAPNPNKRIPAADVIRACHEVVYRKLKAEVRAYVDGTLPEDLEEIARSYLDEPTKASVRIRGGLDGLRACCARCAPHPCVRMVQTLLGWTRDDQTYVWSLDHATVDAYTSERRGAPDDGASGAWTSREQHAALWLYLDWLYPPQETLYPPPPNDALQPGQWAPPPPPQVGGGHGHGAAAAAAAAAAPTRQLGKRAEEPLLPPRMLLPVSDVPKVVACLARRRLLDGKEAMPYLVHAAMSIAEREDGHGFSSHKPLVDIEELLLYWMDLWGVWSLTRRLEAPDPDQLPPREKVRKRSHGKERPPLRIRLRKNVLDSTVLRP